jgi:hypothetical protein
LNDRITLSSLAAIVRRIGARSGERCARPHTASRATANAGREQLIRRVLSTIHNNSILLCGGSEREKKSILLEIKSRLEEGGDSTTNCFPVLVDLHDVPEHLVFAAVADAVLGQLSFASPTKVERFGASYSHRDLAKDFRSVIRTLRESSVREIRLVLLVDGIDELNTYDPRTTQRVRSLFMASLDGSLVMVATAVEIDKHWDQEGSPWYNFFEEIDLSPPTGVSPCPR